MLALLLAAALDVAPLLAPVNAWADAFNRWDLEYPKDAFTDDCAVIDQFPPYVWRSPRTWWTDLMSPDHEKRRAYRQHVVFGAPEFVQVKDGHAYFVQEGTLTWTKNGKDHELHARWVVTETQTKQGWRIDSHAWAPVTER